MKETDKIKELFQSKFNDFEALPPADGWDKIENTLYPKQQKIMRGRMWYAAAAALVALLIGSLFFLRTPEAIQQNTTQFTQEQPSKYIDNNSDNQQYITSPTLSENIENKQLRAEQKKNRPKNNITEETLIAKSITTKEIELNEINTVIINKPEVIEKQTESDSHKQTPQLTQQEIDQRMREFVKAAESENFFTEEVGEIDQSIMLAVNAKGGLTPFQKTVNTPMTLRSASEATSEIENQNLLNYNDGLMNANPTPINMRMTRNISEMEHAHPFSFGITVSKVLTDRIFIETGLVYTYLFSRVKNSNSNYNNQETQHFHYLGIPLNFNYNILDINKLDIYASLGGMLEKDVYGEFKSFRQVYENEFNNSSKSVVTTKINQKNPQLSINAGVGVSYPVYNTFNLYGKVGGSYYFDTKNDFKTIYTDKKIVLDLNVGIRFDF